MKASDLAEPRRHVRRALDELGGDPDVPEIAYHAALVAHTAGYEEGYRRGHDSGSWCIRRNAVAVLIVSAALHVASLALILGLYWRP